MKFHPLWPCQPAILATRLMLFVAFDVETPALTLLKEIAENLILAHWYL